MTTAQALVPAILLRTAQTILITAQQLIPTKIKQLVVLLEQLEEVLLLTQAAEVPEAVAVMLAAIVLG
jgi:hypothetical protein